MKRALTVAAVVALMSSSAYAAPLTLATPGIVGIFDTTKTNASPSTELIYAQHLLDMVGLGAEDSAFSAPNVYMTSTIFDYSGTLVLGIKNETGGFVVPAGWDYVFAKYDGPNAGYIFYHLPTWGSQTIPQYPYAFWGRGGDYELSHFTTFNRSSVPDGGSAALLLGAALMGLAGFRRMLE